MAKIYIIGGGELKAMSDINETIVKDLPKTEGRKPVVLFLPQASSESKPYVNTFYKEFGSRLKCKATCALWLKGEMDREYVAEKIRKADLIYIGGGKYNVLKKSFDVYGMRDLLLNALRDGKTIAGNSAGAMILFEHAVSDYLINEEGGDYSMVSGYGLIKGTVVAHADEDKRINYAKDNGLGDAVFVKSYEYKVIKM